MSFWGGFVQGFAESVDKAVKADMERSNELVDDTVKIGVNKYLENEQEIKKEKKDIRTELEMLTGLGFSLPKAASITKAGMSTTIAKLAVDSDYRGDVNKLWDGTTKYAEENGLTVQDVLNKLVKTPKFSMGDIQVQSSGLLANLGLAQDLGTRIKTGIGTRIGGTSEAVSTREDIGITPGGVPDAAKTMLSSTVDKFETRILKLIDIQKTRKLNETEQKELNTLMNLYVKGDISKMLGLSSIPGSGGGGADIIPSLPELKKLVELAEKGDKKSENLLEGHLETAKRILPYAKYQKLKDSLR